jgi:hypothetical protein
MLVFESAEVAAIQKFFRGGDSPSPLNPHATTTAGGRHFFRGFGIEPDAAAIAAVLGNVAGLASEVGAVVKQLWRLLLSGPLLNQTSPLQLSGRSRASSSAVINS